MILWIDDNKTLDEVKDKFNECFPHLRIEFYRHSHHWKEPSFSNEQITEDKRVGEMNTHLQPGFLDIKSYYKIGKVEQDFHRQFGLHVQILRNEKGILIQPPDTDILDRKRVAEEEHKTV